MHNVWSPTLFGAVLSQLFLAALRLMVRVMDAAMAFMATHDVLAMVVAAGLEVWRASAIGLGLWLLAGVGVE